MRVVRFRDIASFQEGAAAVRVLMTPADRLAPMSITQVDLEPGTATLDHSHDTDQIVYVLDGEALFLGDGETHRLTRDDMIFVPAGTVHRHECAGESVLRQLSIFVPPAAKSDE